MSAGSAIQAPGECLDRFVKALNRGDLKTAVGQLARGACFVTPDATVIYGRQRIRGVLGQLISIGFQAQTGQRSALVLDDFALVSDRWTTRVGGENGAGHRRDLRATTVLRQLEGSWKLLVAAPWGWAT